MEACMSRTFKNSNQGFKSNQYRFLKKLSMKQPRYLDVTYDNKTTLVFAKLESSLRDLVDPRNLTLLVINTNHFL